MKKIISLLLAAMLFTCLFAGCGKEDKDNLDTSSIPVSQGEETSSTASEEASSDDTVSDKTSSEGAASDKTSSLVSSMPTTSNKEDTPAACKHAKTKAVSVSTGKNIIDASKLDVLVHNVVCESCKKVLKTENHSVKDGKCTLCAQSNLTSIQKDIIDAGPTYEGYLKLNEDGSPAFEVMLKACWWSAVKPEYAVDDWNYKIPADAMLKAIREKFVISDEQFEKLKQQGKYHFLFDTHTYKDGYFYIISPAAGGPGEHTHKVVGYSDNKSGKFIVYYDYMSGGADVDEHEHLEYYAVEYNYSGYSNLTIIIGEYDIKQIQGFSPVVDSLRVTAINKLSSLPSDIIKVK